MSDCPTGNDDPGGQNSGGAGRARGRMEVRLKKEVLGVMFDDLTREEAAQAGAALLEEDKFHYVVTPNPEIGRAHV